MIKQKRLLQTVVAVAALVPVCGGAAGIILGPDMVTSVASGPFQGGGLDSHYRYLSGLLFGIGIAFWSTVPRIEEKTARFRLLTLIVVTGGLARLWSLQQTGVPALPMLFALGMELVVTPLLCAWQGMVAKHYGKRPCAS